MQNTTPGPLPMGEPGNRASWVIYIEFVALDDLGWRVVSVVVGLVILVPFKPLRLRGEMRVV